MRSKADMSQLKVYGQSLRSVFGVRVELLSTRLLLGLEFGLWLGFRIIGLPLDLEFRVSVNSF